MPPYALHALLVIRAACQIQLLRVRPSGVLGIQRKKLMVVVLCVARLVLFTPAHPMEWGLCHGGVLAVYDSMSLYSTVPAFMEIDGAS